MGVNITPSRASYIRMLMLIIEKSPIQGDKEWANKELNKLTDNLFTYEV